ncbi:acetylornithine deacetylase [Paramesorhizobium deserti]|uniref:Acetylornithine deacetylase n=1 Tax=Paramesorhizobium deserti TaxID=1494590 RepID=A0A135HN94_9HYPH|nr:acetylornithine deacetylase [Paramesorhizobium deserti]KXF74687.1 acetylornithine deacetylase [Paramesorhizobium deserti]
MTDTAAPYAATLELLERLVAFPTISADSNLDLIDFAERHLIGAGFQTHRLPDPSGRKAGLMARLGPDGPGGVILSAHSDVVPVEGQHWTRPPFQMTCEGGKLYGRGTTDMKGYLASMLSLATRAAKRPPEQPLMLAISYDEEVGCVGIRQMLPGYEALGWQPELCIVGEPTGMRPATGHKGKVALRATCRGSAGHSSLAPHYVNALHIAAEFIMALRRIQDEYAASVTQDAGYDVPYSTVHAGWMQGGTALNIVPDRTSIDFELRHLPGDSPEVFLLRLRQEVDQILHPFRVRDRTAEIKIEVTNSYPGLEIAPEHRVVRRVGALSGSHETIKVTYGTEAGYFAQLGIPAVVCGPGNMEGQGHKPDEYITMGQLGCCDRMMDRLLMQLSASPP